MEDEYIVCNVCVICGAPIPEGRLVCPNCEAEYGQKEEA